MDDLLIQRISSLAPAIYEITESDAAPVFQSTLPTSAPTLEEPGRTSDASIC